MLLLISIAFSPKVRKMVKAYTSQWPKQPELTSVCLNMPRSIAFPPGRDASPSQGNPPPPPPKQCVAGTNLDTWVKRDKME